MYSKRKNKWRKTVNLKAKKYYFKITWFSKKGIFLKFLPNFGFPCPLCRLERQPFWQQAIFDNRMQELPPYYIIAQALNQSSPLFSLYMEEPCWAWLRWCWSFWPRQFAVSYSAMNCPRQLSVLAFEISADKILTKRNNPLFITQPWSQSRTLGIYKWCLKWWFKNIQK